MNEGAWPKVLRSKRTVVSPWLEIIARDVQFFPDSLPETYHAIGQPDYLVTLAVTPQGDIILVRQYRPAIERFSLELPAGLLEENEKPEDAMRRELMEETGYPAKSVELIGTAATCSGRISNITHSFFIQTGEREPYFSKERGIEVSTVTPIELQQLIRSSEFAEQTHLGVLTLAASKGLIKI